jgi:hypothetical protein
MLRDDFEDSNGLQVVDDRFVIPASSDDPTAFFGLNHSADFADTAAPSFGFGLQRRFTGPRPDTIVKPSPTAPSTGPPQQCNGNCGGCSWSFLCTKSIKSLTALRAGLPLLS